MTGAQSILIVEDDPLVAADLQAVVEGFGYRVLGPICSGEEVLELLAAKPPSNLPDLILMDILLAGKLDGIQTAEQIQNHLLVPVVFCSALNDEETLRRARLSKPFGYLLKPFNPDDLKMVIALTLDRFVSESQEEPDADIALSHDIVRDLESGSGGSDQCTEWFGELTVFDKIPPSSIKELCQSSAVLSLDAGEFLIHEGEVVDGCFIPMTGRMSVTKTSESGKELIVSLLAPGDTFGLLYALTDGPISTSVKVQVASRVLWIPKSNIRNFGDREPLFYKNLTVALSERLAAAHALSSSLAHARVEGRIISTLLTLLPNFGKSSGKINGRDQRIYITRKELSELTGTTPETAIRLTKNLERRNLLDLTRPGIIKIPSVEALKEVLVM